VDELEETVSGKRAAVKPNGQPKPGPIGNTQGIIVPDTAPNPYGNSAPDIELETPEEKSFLDKAFEMGDIKVLQKASQGLQDKIDGMVEASGYSVPAMVIGSISKAVVEVFMPTNVIDVVPGGKAGRLAKKGADAAKKGKKAKNADGGGGGKDMGHGRCKLKAYSKGCPAPQTPHHVVPDHCFKQPGKNGAYYPGGIPHADGLSICVGGATKSTGADGSSIKRIKGKLLEAYRQLAEHGKIHVFTDAGEYALGQAGDPKGTTTLGQMEDLGARVVGKITGCDPADLKKQLRDFHRSRGLDASDKVRADPFGHVKNLDPSTMGTGQGRGVETY
jgi:hypothetical protein